MSSALVRATALRLLAAGGGSLAAEALLEGLAGQLPAVGAEDLHGALAGLLHRGALALDEDGCYKPGKPTGRNRLEKRVAADNGGCQPPSPPAKQQRRASQPLLAPPRQLPAEPRGCPAADNALLPTEDCLLGSIGGGSCGSQAAKAEKLKSSPDGKTSKLSPSGRNSSGGEGWESLPQARRLSDEQREVMSAVWSGENAFFTGLPGTGKSFTLCALIEALRKRLKEGELAICASTGAAACHIGGGTLHSFLGCGLGKEKDDFDRMTRHAFRLKLAKAVVVDEISMISGEFLEMASAGLGKARGRPGSPFGGLQVVLCGDFMQLPPVTADPVLQRPGARRFAFQAPCWQELGLQCFELTRNFRQAEDTGFQATLRRIRVGQMTGEDRAMLLRQSGAAGVPQKSGDQRRDEVLKTTLYCRNVDVEGENLSRLARLSGEEVVFTAEDTCDSQTTSARAQLEKILEKCMAARCVKLKVGARVMLLKNLRLPDKCSRGEVPLVNGSVGEVDGFEEYANGKLAPVVRFSGGCQHVVCQEAFAGSMASIGNYKRLQVPLKLAWAVSVHKSQGMTLEGGVVDLRGAFEEGQVYVALSRFRTAANIAVMGLPPQLRVSHQAMSFHEQLRAHTGKGSNEEERPDCGAPGAQASSVPGPAWAARGGTVAAAAAWPKAAMVPPRPFDVGQAAPMQCAPATHQAPLPAAMQALAQPLAPFFAPRDSTGLPPPMVHVREQMLGPVAAMNLPFPTPAAAPSSTNPPAPAHAWAPAPVSAAMPTIGMATMPQPAAAPRGMPCPTAGHTQRLWPLDPSSLVQMSASMTMPTTSTSPVEEGRLAVAPPAMPSSAVAWPAACQALSAEVPRQMDTSVCVAPAAALPPACPPAAVPTAALASAATRRPPDAAPAAAASAAAPTPGRNLGLRAGFVATPWTASALHRHFARRAPAEPSLPRAGASEGASEGQVAEQAPAAAATDSVLACASGVSAGAERGHVQACAA